MEDLIKDSSAFIATDQINGVWSFLMSIDWSERWLQGVLAAHVCLLLLSVLTRHVFAAQAMLFFLLLSVVYGAESFNRLGAEYWKLFSRQQYFDSSGMFFSLVVSMPLLTICLVIMIQWVYQSSGLLINLKRRQLLGKQQTDNSTQDKKKR